MLGPTAFGKIPGFTDALFNPTAMNNLNLVANLGLIFYLFIMGLELEPQLLKKAMKTTAVVSVLAIAVPFGLSMPVGYFMYLYFILNETLTNSTLNPTGIFKICFFFNVKLYLFALCEDLLLIIQGEPQASLLSFLLFIGVASSITV